MRKFLGIAIIALSVPALAGAAAASNRTSHVIDVPLPGGSRAHVEYVGDVAPKVTVEPAGSGDSDWEAMPAFAGFDTMIAQMDRESEAMMHRVQEIATQPAAAGAARYAASIGSAPAGVTSTTIVSYSNQSGTCTRTTQAVSQGPRKPAKVTSSVTGNCAAAAAPEPSASSLPPINRT